MVQGPYVRLQPNREIFLLYPLCIEIFFFKVQVNFEAQNREKKNPSTQPLEILKKMGLFSVADTFHKVTYQIL